MIFFSLQIETWLIWFGHRKKNQVFHYLYPFINKLSEVLTLFLVKWIPIITTSTPKIILITYLTTKIPIIKIQINFSTNVLKTYLKTFIILVLHQISISHPLLQTFIHIMDLWWDIHLKHPLLRWFVSY